MVINNNNICVNIFFIPVFDEMKNITNCLMSSGQSATIVNRCSTPYLNGLKDKTSDICE